MSGNLEQVINRIENFSDNHFSREEISNKNIFELINQLSINDQTNEKANLNKVYMDINSQKNNLLSSTPTESNADMRDLSQPNAFHLIEPIPMNNEKTPEADEDVLINDEKEENNSSSSSAFEGSNSTEIYNSIVSNNTITSLTNKTRTKIPIGIPISNRSTSVKVIAQIKSYYKISI